MKVKKIEIPEGAVFATLYDQGLHLPLKEAADRITEHNKELLARSRNRDFNPAVELDASGNSGVSNLHFLAEQVVLYPEGWVPFECAEECRESSELLVERLMELHDAPIAELDEFRYRFRNFFDSWMLNYNKPRMEEFYYRKRIFRLLDEVHEALMAVHKAYLLGDLRKRVRALGRTKRKWGNSKRYVFDKVDELRERGFSVPKALDYLRSGNCSQVMQGAGNATWRRDYYMYKKGC